MMPGTVAIGKQVFSALIANMVQVKKSLLTLTQKNRTCKMNTFYFYAREYHDSLRIKINIASNMRHYRMLHCSGIQHIYHAFPQCFV